MMLRYDHVNTDILNCVHYFSFLMNIKLLVLIGDEKVVFSGKIWRYLFVFI